MYPYDAILVGIRYLPQLLHIWPDEFRSSLAEHAEDLRRFHPYLVIRIVQEFIEYRQMILIDVRRVRGDVF